MDKIRRTIGFHPCVGEKASGEARPTSVVIRNADGTHAAYGFDEQQLLDLFTCGAAVTWRGVTKADLAVRRPPHHHRRAGSDAQVPAELVVLNPETDIVGVANGGLGRQITEILLGRYPDMDVRVIGSGTLKEHRAAFDALLPAALRRKAEQLRAAASGTAEVEPPERVGDNGEDNKFSKSSAKDANAKFDAHRIAYALADDAASMAFHHCTLRDRDWAAATVAYNRLEAARKARVAAEQQFRQLHRAGLRRLVQDRRIPYVTVSAGDEGEKQIANLLASYEATLRLVVADESEVAEIMETLRLAHTRIRDARTLEREMERYLEQALEALPEYTEFLAQAKATVNPETGLPLGKYIGERIFGRLIAGFGSPMASRLHEPVRPADAERIAACRRALTEAIAAIDHTGLPQQPPSGNGKTREWLLACARIAQDRQDIGQSAQIAAAHDAYRRLTNAKKSATNRPLNRVIAFMGLHVRQGGKYTDTPKDREFPRRRKGGRANWNESLLRQGAYQWATLIIKGGDSYWKKRVYEPYKARLIASGLQKGHAHKRAMWRMTTMAMRWLIAEWFKWERSRVPASRTGISAQAAE